MASPNRPFPGRPARIAPHRLGPSTDYVSQIRRVHDHHGGLRDGGHAVARRQLLTDEERQALFGIPDDPDGLARLFHPGARRPGPGGRAPGRCQPARLRGAARLAAPPGTTLANLGRPAEALVTWMARQLEIPPRPSAATLGGPRR